MEREREIALPPNRSIIFCSAELGLKLVSLCSVSVFLSFHYEAETRLLWVALVEILDRKQTQTVWRWGFKNFFPLAFGHLKKHTYVIYFFGSMTIFFLSRISRRLKRKEATNSLPYPRVGCFEHLGRS